jgi:hypothetical protein
MFSGSALILMAIGSALAWPTYVARSHLRHPAAVAAPSLIASTVGVWGAFALLSV